MSLLSVVTLTCLVGTVPQATEKTSLAWRLAEKDTFWVTYHQLQTFETRGLLQTAKDMKDLRVLCRFRVLEKKASGLIVEQRIEQVECGSLSLNPETGLRADLPKLKGKVLRVTLDDQMRVAKLEGLGPVVEQCTKVGSLPVAPAVVQRCREQFEAEISYWLLQLFYPGPGGPVTSDSRWKGSYQKEFGPATLVREERQYRYLGPVAKQGGDLHAIDVQVRTSFPKIGSTPAEPAANAALMEVKLLDQDLHGRIELDVRRGRPTRLGMSGTYTIRRALPVNGLPNMTDIVNQVSITVTVLDQDPRPEQAAALRPASTAAGAARTPAPLRQQSNSLGMKLVQIPPGRFIMGVPRGDRDASEFNQQHPVEITRSFWMGVHEVTIGQYRRFVEATGYKTSAERNPRGCCGYDKEHNRVELSPRFSWKHPGWEVNDHHPAVNLSWDDAQAFCAWLSKKEGKKYRLPTEAEWEYTCRAGTQTAYHHGNDPEALAKMGNVADALAKKMFPHWDCLAGSDGFLCTAPVGSYQPNAFDLYDMHGNALEWCQDYFWHYGPEAERDPQGPPFGFLRQQRGGGWADFAHQCTSGHRCWAEASFYCISSGFRVVLEVE
jgi:formylglycine-generating enzyme required for sulfatase activity